MEHKNVINNEVSVNINNFVIVYSKNAYFSSFKSNIFEEVFKIGCEGGYFMN